MDVVTEPRTTRRRRGVLAVAVLLIVALAALAAVAASHTAKAPVKRSHAGLEVVTLEPNAAAALKAKGKTARSRFPDSVNQGKKFNPAGGLVAPLTTGAEQHVLVLFAKFDTTPPGAPADRIGLSLFDDLLFGTSYDPPEYQKYADHPTDRTLKNYYQAASFGNVDIITYDMPSSMGWADAGHPYDYFCKADGVHDNGFGPYPQNVQGLVIDAISAAKAADPTLDFSNYAVDGAIPNLFVVFAGTGAEWSGTPELIWSHSWDLSEGTGMDGYTVDGVKVNNYAMMPEVGGDLTGYAGAVSGPYPPTVGVFAHEYGHVLGLPDQYDYGYESEGTGKLSLMAAGSWNRYPADMIFDGNSPAQLDAWSKYRLGFITPIDVDVTTNVTLPPAETNAVAYKMIVPNSGGREYFLFENRQNVGFDQGLQYRYRDASDQVVSQGIHGLAVYHVDDSVFTLDYWRPNEAQNWKEFRSEGAKKAENGATHYAISLVQADDRWDLEHGTNAGDPGDLYPGSTNATSLSSQSRPNTSSYYFWQGNAPKFGYSGVTASNIMETVKNTPEIGQNVSLTLSLVPFSAK